MIKNLLIVLIVLLLLLTLISTFGGSIRFQETYADVSEDEYNPATAPMMPSTMMPPPSTATPTMMAPPSTANPMMQEPYAHAPAHTIPTTEQDMEDEEPVGAGSTIEPFDGGAYASC